MLNSISLVGKIVKNVYHVENMAFIDIEVKRPFPEEIGKEKFDVFSIALWKGLEDMMSDVAQIGMIIAVRGRLIANKFTMVNYDFKEVIIYGELIEILNKYF
ncbi:hypothetical protein DW760_04015 [Coprobacillus sp. AM29-13]|jgi:single-stranded DNA-binding protein|uniref:hypothetical protein n=1 Tax=Faecalibacillus intestinalis TaxID=1982626 RepID=UPI000E42C638|nr:hypothetical protein [Faecalibacillus intestinalis]RGE96527.1 hypothetical protein DW660_03665 [Coprobacillus sp. AM23-9LB]RGG83817.1 hypothetical protein DWW80_03880 [Coprobacillus sp. AF17-17AC]RGG87556.1 hypothetical protein DWW76_03490 [Coprobacillus sp. AF17-11AC]RHR18549.1 hypothetical protein DWX48_05025 [Coprobacillus sp. AF19-3]RHT53542.1 hypothetical protein DW760_04015 [Coprobacillus sp. AM29-13]